MINLAPKPQSRPRFGRGGRVYEDRTMADWRKTCTRLIREAWQGELLTGSIMVEASFFIAPPKYIKTTKYLQPALQAERIYCDKRPDLDNYEKALYDSISDSGLVWRDDGQVVCHRAEKRYSLTPRIEVTIRAVGVDEEGWHGV